MHYFCNFQGVERAIPTTTLAAKNVVGEESRHGYILMLNESRKRFNGKPPRKADYVRWLNEINNPPNNP